MATQAQIDANRRNAQRSTGPRTPEGKSASRMNSLQHGLTAVKIFPAQNQPEFDALAADYAARFEPETVEQRERVDTMLHADWNLRRYRQLHEDTWEALRQESPALTDAQLLLADLRGARIIDKLLRYQKDLQRTYDRALAEFARVAKVEAEATEVLLRNQHWQVRQDGRGDETNPISSSDRKVQTIDHVFTCPTSAASPAGGARTPACRVDTSVDA